MLDRGLGALGRLVTGWPRALALGLLILTGPLGLYASGLQVSTSRTALVSEDEPHWQRYLAFAAEFGLPEDLVVVAESPDPAARGRFVDRTAALLEAAQVGRVFARAPLAALSQRGLYQLPLETLAALSQALSSAPGRSLWGAPDLGSQLDALAALVEAAPSGGALAPAATASAAQGLAALSTALARSAQGRPIEVAAWGRPPAPPPGLDAEGRLAAGAHRSLILVRPPYTRDEIGAVSDFVGQVRRAAEQAQAETGVAFGLTGLPATMVDELSSITHDAQLTTVLSLVGVIILFLAFFPSLRLLGIAIAPVLLGVVWTAAAIRAVYGHLNLMSSIFLVVIIGMGIDFSVHLLARIIDEGRAGRTPPEAARYALAHTGRGLLTGALTSTGAFLTLLGAGFQGIEELGGSAAIGLVMTLGLSMVLVPALASQSPAILLRGGARLGVGTLLGWVRRGPGLILAGALLLTAPALGLALQTRFDFSLLELLPKQSESARLMSELMAEPSFSAQAAVLVAPDLETARALTERARHLSTVREAHSAADFLPAEGSEKQALLAAWPGPADPPPAPVPLDVGLARLEAAVDHAAELAFAARRPELPALLAAQEGLSQTQAALQGARRAEAELGLSKLETQLKALRSQALLAFAEARQLGPPDLAVLPEALTGRFVSEAGRYAVYVVPKASIWDRPALGRFLGELRTLGTVTGFPETFYENSGLIRDGFVRAAGLAFLVVLLLVTFDLRRPRDVVLSILPVALGAIWMLGSLAGLGLAYNLANVVGVPLIAGVAIDGGVHLLHRYRESQDLEAAMVQTGSAVMLSSLTTMVGFGSLAFASHRGYQSLGVILFLGVGTSLLVAMVVLPAALLLWERRAR